MTPQARGALPLRHLRRLRTMLGPAGASPSPCWFGLAVTQGFDGAAFGVLAPEIRHAFGLDNAGSTPSPRSPRPCR